MKLMRGETLRLDAPPGAVQMHVVGQGANVVAEVVGGQGVLESERTLMLAPGAYAVGWRVVAPNGDVSLPAGPPLTVCLALSEQFDVPPTRAERLLKAGRAALESSSETGDLSVTVAGYSATFETKAALQSWVVAMEATVRRERRAKRGLGPIRMRPI